MGTEPETFAHFLAAVAAQDDEEAESLVPALDREAASRLLRLAHAEDPNIRWWSVRALADCGDGDAVAVISERLRDDDPAIRATAALALGHLYTDYPCAVTDELPRMAELLADPDGLVRQSAVNGLSICGDAAVPALTLVLAAPHQGARTRATGALRRIGTMAAARVLFGLLNDENYLVRMYAHEGLDEMGLLENVLLFT